MNGRAIESEAGIPRPAPESVWVVAYDISDPKRLRRIARVLLDHGERIQWSLFCCVLTNWQRRCVAEKLGEIIDRRVDSVRFYPLRCQASVGRGPALPAARPQYFIV